MTRPTFEAAWAASLRIYSPSDSSGKVAQVVGGAVARNINAPAPYKWTNTCAVRMSYILNQSGVLIPARPEATVTGADKRHYFYRVPDLISFLTQQWGKPDLVVPYPPPGGGQLAGKKGVVMFEVTGWRDARGHATLWDGSICYDHCYFNEPGVNYRTDRANFWSLR
ncbi:type VI secretion system amidase effector protein Tae4 [Caldimonas brevitalea]|uniref:Cytoplasmic protein n=1 Tax=Caldimonas brevitalea TaxID=413882 RepID=A0A0G3BGZ3_9BURK|nr:type VI secretion system amidase effector protein Tae4 [Caldimonas brevitalea]AKJ28714.1 cytoplasmic protein [Caldimonas brevitalea]